MNEWDKNPVPFLSCLRIFCHLAQGKICRILCSPYILYYMYIISVSVSALYSIQIQIQRKMMIEEEKWELGYYAGIWVSHHIFIFRIPGVGIIWSDYR